MRPPLHWNQGVGRRGAGGKHWRHVRRIKAATAVNGCLYFLGTHSPIKVCMCSTHHDAHDLLCLGAHAHAQTYAQTRRQERARSCTKHPPATFSMPPGRLLGSLPLPRPWLGRICSLLRATPPMGPTWDGDMETDKSCLFKAMGNYVCACAFCECIYVTGYTRSLPRATPINGLHLGVGKHSCMRVCECVSAGLYGLPYLLLCSC